MAEYVMDMGIQHGTKERNQSNIRQVQFCIYFYTLDGADLG